MNGILETVDTCVAGVCMFPSFELIAYEMIRSAMELFLDAICLKTDETNNHSNEICIHTYKRLSFGRRDDSDTDVHVEM